MLWQNPPPSRTTAKLKRAIDGGLADLKSHITCVEDRLIKRLDGVDAWFTVVDHDIAAVRALIENNTNAISHTLHELIQG